MASDKAKLINEPLIFVNLSLSSQHPVINIYCMGTLCVEGEIDQVRHANRNPAY